jgi:phosphate transport system substrate-binding protein
MGTAKKLGAIALLIGAFAGFDLSLYGLFTKRCIDTSSEEMQKYSVELHRYMPFDSGSEAVKAETELKLSGDLPVLDGAAALYPVFSGVVNSVYPEDSVEFSDGAFTDSSALHYTNTRGAYKAVVDGDADIIFCAKPNDEQLGYAEKNGAELEMVPIGKEAFVFIVNRDNPVDGLTAEQVRDIFAGDITTWSEVGGEHLPIEALSRNEGSGSQTTMDKFMAGREQKQSPFGIFGRSIGYSFRYYVENMVENGGAKMLELDGVYPDREHIADGTYPLASTFYAVYRKDNTNGQIPVLIDWILSDEGQSVVEKAGYVPLG